MTEFYIYWASTALLSLLYLSSATLYLVKRDWVRETIIRFGYPSYLRPLLIAVKIAAVAAILSRINVGLSDLAYAGMLFHLILSAMAHIGIRKPTEALPALLGLALVAASFSTQNAARVPQSPYAHTATAPTSTF